MLRLVNLVVLAALVFAAAYVYKIKYEAVLQDGRVAKLRADIRRERDAIATLRAEWTQLDNPARVQTLAKRHLTLKPLEVPQFDKLDNLPEMPPQLVPPGTADPIGAIIEAMADGEVLTGSLPDPAKKP